MLTLRRHLLGQPQVSRRPRNNAERLLWILQGESGRIRVTYPGVQRRAPFERRIDLLSTVIPLIHVRVQVDVGDELIEDRSTRLNHPI